MPLAGSLHDIALTDLIQITCQENRQARLVVQHEGKEAEIFFDGGNIVHARLDDLEGEEVIHQLLGWAEGEFHLESDVAPPTRTIETPWSALLMQGLQRYDELQWEASQLTTEEDNDMASTQASLQNLLTELGQEIQGFIAAAVVGMDGFGIANHAVDAKVQVESINAQMTMFTKLVQTSTTKLKAGNIEDNLLTTEQAIILVRFLEDDNYYLSIVADRSKANIGNLRLYSRLYAEQLSKAIPH